MKIDSFLVIILLLILPYESYSQSQISISAPRLELQGKKLHIIYDLLNSQPKDRFLVWLEITDESGDKIQPNALSGDIGEKISGGIDKIIIWDLEKDGILINEEIFVEVFAERTYVPIIQKDQEKINSEGTPAESKRFTRSNIVISSVILPGWGQSKTSRGKPYYVLGVVGYGCLGCSVILNRVAIGTYNDYKISLDVDERLSLFDKSVTQDNISEYLAFAAAGIWAANIIWALVTPISSTELSDIEMLKNINIQPAYNQKLNCAMVSFSYSF